MKRIYEKPIIELINLNIEESISTTSRIALGGNNNDPSYNEMTEESGFFDIEL